MSLHKAATGDRSRSADFRSLKLFRRRDDISLKTRRFLLNKILKAKCPRCHKFIEFPSHGEGRTIGCPHCGHETVLRAWSPEIAAELEEQQSAYVKTTLLPKGTGCTALLAGVVLLFFFPWGTLAGIGLLIWSVRLAKAFVCSRCGNPLNDRALTICPSCKMPFQPKPTTNGHEGEPLTNRHE